ncbi:hypothetical protein [Spirosoma koreense]
MYTPLPRFTNTPGTSLSESTLIGPEPLPEFSAPEPLPAWLLDEETLRDEGVLFGLSDAPPDGKVAEIRAAFGQLAAPLEEVIEHCTEKIGELNLFIEQRENRLTALQNQFTELSDRQPAPNNLIRTVASLCLSITLCIGNFFLIDETLRPAFPNRWVAVGVFLAGMFNLFGRTSFFYETDSRLSGRRIMEETGLPLAASVFILVHALQTQSTGAALGLFVFVSFLFLLAGKLLLSTLTALQTDLTVIRQNQQHLIEKAQHLPLLASDIERLEREVDEIRAQKWPIVTALNQAQANSTQLNTRRDRLVNLYMSEFELARSLRERLSEQQRKLIMTYD